MFLNLFFKNKGPLAFVHQCFVSLRLSFAGMYFWGEDYSLSTSVYLQPDKLKVFPLNVVASSSPGD